MDSLKTATATATAGGETAGETLTQVKLTGDEWNSVEIMEPEEEMRILKLIIDGFHDVNRVFNPHLSLISRLKITATPEMEDYLFDEYFRKRVERVIAAMMRGHGDGDSSVGAYEIKSKSKKTMKKVDLMRIQNMNTTFRGSGDTYDHYIMDTIEAMIAVKDAAAAAAAGVGVNEWMKHYYTLKLMLQKSVVGINPHILDFAEFVIKTFSSDIQMIGFLRNAYRFVEQNDAVFKYADFQLYEHQKQLFTVAKRPDAKLVLYIAPTGTGKTLSPLGLSEKYKIIFVCAARHVGLALAKAAISVKKRIAFAFGCSNIDDIRLHYYAAKEAIRDKRSGRIRKVDNSIGDNVEIMICDIRSYLLAMRYMMAFHPIDQLLMYWDEPTISLDYPDHALHPIIHRNWSGNLIPNVVLSSATLPREDEIVDVIQDFKVKFHDKGAEIYSVVSHDFKKSIPIVNQNGFIELPHYMFGQDYDRVLECVEHCKTYKTLMRYFDLREILRFIGLVTKPVTDDSDSDSDDSDESDESDDSDSDGHGEKEKKPQDTDPNTDDNRGLVITSQRYLPENMFTDIGEITMTSIKEYYLILLENIRPKYWTRVYETLRDVRKPKFTSVVNLSTSDAHTLTDGPTIYLTEQVDKVAAFMLQIAKIPTVVMEDIMATIDFNTTILEEIQKTEKLIKDLEGESKDPSAASGGGAGGGGDEKKTRKFTSDTRVNPETERLHIKVEELKKSVKYTALHELFVPNRLEHLKRWTTRTAITNEFTSFVEDEVVEQIMLLNVATHWKLLLLMGIGAITNATDQKYTDIMKTLAKHQKLYLIITATDYIYGTNYQFCHGYIGKDLEGMSQEKAIQSMGRIGRGAIQQDYTIRVRHDAILHHIFTAVRSSAKPEVCAMNRLFVTEAADTGV
jgi:hypothetical protein